MSIDKNTRLIDLTVGELFDLFQAWSAAPAAVTPTKDEADDEIGGYEVAEKITGYARQTLYQLKSAGELPYIALPGGGFRFSARLIREWLLAHQRVSASELTESAEALKLRRFARRK